jgi:HAD superfamily phosphatase (TIGR01668 family)
MTWIRHMHQQGINVALITNNGGDRMKAISRQTQLGCVMRAMKPLPTSYKKLVQGMGGGKILFIGDQLLTDVLGAKFAGHPVVWCQSLGGPEHWLTRFNRNIERFIANRLIASGKMPKERVL